MKNIYLLIILVPTFYFSQIAVPNGQTQPTANPETGNVGIRIDSPSHDLTIRSRKGLGEGQPSGGKSTNAILRIVASDEGYGEVLDFGMSIAPSSGWIQPQNFQDGMHFYNLALNPLGGNVGIGTSNPQSKLEIYGGGDLALRGATTDAGDLIFQQGSGVQNARIWSMDNGGLMFSGRDNIPKFMITDIGNALLKGKLEAIEIKVTTSPTADFVFEESYNLPKLEEVEKHIKEKKHLPEIASAKEMETNGVNVGEFQIKLLQKIEELTLHVIEQNKLNKEQSFKIEKLERELKRLKN